MVLMRLYWIVCELVKDMGYSCQTKAVATEDGYIVEVDRVWQNTTATLFNEDARGNPVLLVPGMLDDSATWFLNYPSQSAGFMLADKGYDVWAMNTREAAKRCHHKEWDQSDPRYWEWSFNEIGQFDVAAAIELALTTTGASTLAILAFSQGFTSSLVLLSTKPEYNAKLLIDPLGRGGRLSFPGTTEATGNFFCSIFGGELCSVTLFLALTVTPQQVNKTRTPVYMAHTYQGTSIKNLRHFVQIAKSKKFAMYDNGKVENLRNYGTVEPPEYPLKRISVPVALFSAVGDRVANPVDVADLVKTLDSVVVLDYVVPIRNFRHDDFILSYKAAVVLHQVMIATLANYTTTARKVV
ncbi:gastric triacylglycerol lipase [Rhipicephalus sanguineus]|uniref:gastric triacylglycerol lipase n=1 Tax=Rhipicephalus sanguineus TaxID=34632 RepID=UPI0020C271BF|nr:gastric triacylglycerol lipase [Rhipicephalus sanguineus]